jgi:hypothetical protein
VPIPVIGGWWRSFKNDLYQGMPSRRAANAELEPALAAVDVSAENPRLKPSTFAFYHGGIAEASPDTKHILSITAPLPIGDRGIAPNDWNNRFFADPEAVVFSQTC